MDTIPLHRSAGRRPSRRNHTGIFLSNLADNSRIAASPRISIWLRMPSTTERTWVFSSSPSVSGLPRFRWVIAMGVLYAQRICGPGWERTCRGRHEPSVCAFALRERHDDPAPHLSRENSDCRFGQTGKADFLYKSAIGSKIKVFGDAIPGDNPRSIRLHDAVDTAQRHPGAG